MSSSRFSFVSAEFNFKEFASSILEQIAEILIRLLVVQAISAGFGLGGGGATGLVQAGSAAIQGRQDGGTIQPGRSFLVGEDGPEIITPGRTSAVTPNAGMAQEPPQVNILSVTVTSLDQVKDAMASGEFDEIIINRAGENKDSFNQAVT